MSTFTDKIDSIKETILKYVSARYIFLFCSYAYGKPTERSDIDIYIVIPDDISNVSELYGKIIGDLGDKEIFFIDLLLSKESVFNIRKTQNILEKTIIQKGKILYAY